MCWNEQVSFVTFIIVVIVIFFVIQQNPSQNVRWQCYFALTFITIQLLEGFLWISIKNKNNKLNAIVTALVLLLLWAQPFVQCYFGAKLGAMSATNRMILLIAAVIFGVVFIYMIFKVIQGDEKYYTVTTESCHLQWIAERNNNGKNSVDSGNSFMSNSQFMLFLYMAGLFVPLFMMLPRKHGLILAGVGIILWVLSRYFYQKDGSFSSMWCFLAIFYVLAILFIHFVVGKDKNHT